MSAADQPTARAAIEAQQIEQLRALLGEILPANRFYTRKLAGCGVVVEVRLGIGGHGNVLSPPILHIALVVSRS